MTSHSMELIEPITRLTCDVSKYLFGDEPGQFWEAVEDGGGEARVRNVVFEQQHFVLRLTITNLS